MIIDTPEGIARFRTAVLLRGLIGYQKYKIIPSRGVTPTRMLKLASEVTGVTYKRGAYAEAIADLEAWLAS